MAGRHAHLKSPRLIGALVFSAALGGSALACDQGSQHQQPTFTRYVSLVSSTADATHPVPADGIIALQFDRYLNPSTVTRQSFIVTDASGQPLQGALVSYDPIALTVSIASPNTPGAGTSSTTPWLTAGQSYKLFLPVSGSSTDISGLRAIDNAPLDPAVGPIEIAFNVSAAKGAASVAPTMKFCADILPIFDTKCSGSLGCHGHDDASDPAAGMYLTTAEGVAQTAIGRISQGSNTSGISGQAVPPNRVFGLNFPIIDPGHAATSWLVYKIAMAPAPDNSAVSKARELCPDATGKSEPPHAYTVNTSAYPLNDDEQAVLSDAILGRSMPYPSYGAPAYNTNPLDLDERERVRLWIDQGAHVEPCGICATP